MKLENSVTTKVSIVIMLTPGKLYFGNLYDFDTFFSFYNDHKDL